MKNLILASAAALLLSVSAFATNEEKGNRQNEKKCNMKECCIKNEECKKACASKCTGESKCAYENKSEKTTGQKNETKK